MADPGFREIQLSTKQVVFLFMACLVAAVAIFLLGVSVGRGVNPALPGEVVVQTPEPGADVTLSGGMPPATTPQAGDLKYHEDLQGKPEGRGAAVAPPATVSEAPPDVTPTPTATPTPAAAAPARPSPSQAGAPAASGYFVQVNSFGSRANATRQVADLKTRGFSAVVFDAGGSGARYRVRLGPYADRSAAETIAARLRKEGFTPSITR